VSLPRVVSSIEELYDDHERVKAVRKMNINMILNQCQSLPKHTLHAEQ
jgi:hypothetical protein